MNFSGFNFHQPMNFADIILRLEWLTTCSDLEMADGDEARAVINEVLPSLKKIYIDKVKTDNLKEKDNEF